VLKFKTRLSNNLVEMCKGWDYSSRCVLYRSCLCDVCMDVRITRAL